MCMCKSLHVYICTRFMPGTIGGQKREWDPLEMVSQTCEPPIQFWELNWDPLEEQSVFLITEPFLQLSCFVLFEMDLAL